MLAFYIILYYIIFISIIHRISLCLSRVAFVLLAPFFHGNQDNPKNNTSNPLIKTLGFAFALLPTASAWGDVWGLREIRGGGVLALGDQTNLQVPFEEEARGLDSRWHRSRPAWCSARPRHHPALWSCPQCWLSQSEGSSIVLLFLFFDLVTKAVYSSLLYSDHMFNGKPCNLWKGCCELALDIPCLWIYALCLRIKLQY